MSHGAAMSVIADNIANSNTPGFKSRRPEFSSLLAEAEGGLYSPPASSGNGVRVSSVSTLHDIQGAMDDTGRELDLALQGKGFFQVSDGTDTYYTRAGNFVTDPNGDVVTVEGEQLLGYTTENPDTPAAINVRSVESGATPTTSVSVSGNLDAREAIQTPITNPTSYSAYNKVTAFSFPITVIDSLGVNHDVDLNFTKTGNLTWLAQAVVDSGDLGLTAETPTILGSSSITFQSDGTQASTATTSLTISPNWGNGSTQTQSTIDLTGLTTQGTYSYAENVVGDGQLPGTLSKIEVDTSGKVVAKMDNGTQVTVATLALAIFPNPDGLRSIGSNKFALDEKAGTASVGVAGTEGRGIVKGSALESSTVDLAKQFVDVIRYQRGYQASSQILNSLSDMLNRTIQLA